MADEWRSLKLGDAVTLKRGYDLRTPDRKESGTVPVVSSSGISGRHNEAKVQPPGVITGRYGTIGEVYFLTEPFWPLNTTLYVEDFHGNDPFFISHFLKTIDFKKFSDKTGVPGVNRNDLHEIPVVVPPLSEQRKIAAILGTWDEAIALTERRIATGQQRKQGLMQGLLTGRVRFPGFQESWRETPLGEFLTLKLRQVPKPTSGYPALGVRSHGKGTFVKQVDDPNHVDMDYLYEVKAGDLVVNITFAWEGAIAIVKQSDDGRLVSHRFPTYVFNRDRVDPDFFRHLMVTKRFFYQLGLISPGGAGRNRVMNKTDFLTIRVDLPPIREQERCAAILNLADRELDLLARKRDALQRQKRGLMQQLLTGRVRVKVQE